MFSIAPSDVSVSKSGKTTGVYGAGAGAGARATTTTPVIEVYTAGMPMVRQRKHLSHSLLL